MKDKKVIHIVKHTPTGAKVPMIINKVNDDNVIINYKEHSKDRKGFTISMLQNRWDKTKEDVIEILDQFKVPGHIDHNHIKNNLSPIDVAIFFEEYIFGIEKKTKMPHKKLKPRLVESRLQ